MFAVTAFIEGVLFALFLCLDLGIVNMAIMKTGMERGFKPALMIGFGSCFGDLFYLSLALLGISIIFEYTIVKWAMWIVGSGVLFYLTYKMLRETWNAKKIDLDSTIVVERSPIRDWLLGVGLAVASPTSIAWFAFVAGPIIMSSSMKQHGGMLYFIIGFFIGGLLWSIGVALISSLSRKYVSKFGIQALSFLSAMLILYFAIKVFYNGFTDVLGG
ncbi:MAG: LysE family transporter [Candidatus Cohnella colombiensis]|uniref:LysE family transporter n=1 Tax=Candidatus Cohnella colombiensis TaxID=3121368 RepID=A0AA95EV51_9BACL|nr:MAG: LysE family transporter [Cohnella sp.]